MKVPPVPVPGLYRSVSAVAACLIPVAATQVEGSVPASTSTPPGRITSPTRGPVSNRVAYPARFAPMVLAGTLQGCVLGSYTSAVLSVVTTTVPEEVELMTQLALVASTPPNATK